MVNNLKIVFVILCDLFLITLLHAQATEAETTPDIDYDSTIFPSNFIDENKGKGVWE